MKGFLKEYAGTIALFLIVALMAAFNYFSRSAVMLLEERVRQLEEQQRAAKNEIWELQDETGAIRGEIRMKPRSR